MLYIIYGNDRKKGRAQLHALRDKLMARGARALVVAEDAVSATTFDEMVASRELFGGVTLFTFDNILEKKTEQELIVAYAQKFAESPNLFLFFEPLFSKEITDELISYADEAIECSTKKLESKPLFNIFTLGDALGTRDKKELWLLFQNAQRNGIGPEEICGTLFWSVKNMALMKDSALGDDVGLNPFVAKKARGFAARYTREEIAHLSHSLVTLYHEAHRGGEPMDIALERFILNL